MDDDPSRPKGISGSGTDPRVSTQERESAVQSLQAAYTRGQLEVGELDDRIRLALKAKVQSDLQHLLSDLPVPVEPPPAPVLSERRSSLKLAAHGGTVQKTGRWIVPASVRGLLYKGTMVLDFRDAVLTSAQTVVKVAAYKSRLEVIVPRGYRVETRAHSYKASWVDLTNGGSAGPVIILKGFAYKASVVIKEAES